MDILSADNDLEGNKGIIYGVEKIFKKHINDL